MSRFNSLEFNEPLETPSAISPAVKDAQYYVDEADASFRRGRFEEALRFYAKVLEFDPRSPAAWTGQVRMLIELGEFAEAKLWADKALETLPKEAELLAAKAVALARCGDVDEALMFSDAAVESRGDTPYVWMARGDVLLARAEKRADFCFEKALGLAARDWFVHWLVCRIYCYYRKFSRALHFAQRALELDATCAVAWLQFGRCQLALGLRQQAALSFEHAKELDPLCQPGSSDVSDLSSAGLWARVRGWWRQTLQS